MRAVRAAACRVPRALYNTADTVSARVSFFTPGARQLPGTRNRRKQLLTPTPPKNNSFEMRAGSPPLSRSAYRGLKRGGVGFAVPLLLLAAFNGSGSPNKLRVPFRSLASQIKVRAQPKVTAPVQKGQSICRCTSQLILKRLSVGPRSRTGS